MKQNEKRSLPLLLLLALFTATFFVYRDFGIRMLLGFGVLCLILGAELVKRIVDRKPLEPQAVRGAMLMLRRSLPSTSSGPTPSTAPIPFPMSFP